MVNVGHAWFKMSETIFMPTFAKDTQITCNPLDECLPLSWRLAQALRSKRRRTSWCGLSFPLSWPRCSMGVRGVWEKPVWKGREEVCIYLCWWGMIPTLICLQTSSWTALRAAEAIRSQPQRAYSVMLGLHLSRWKAPASSGIAAGAVKAPQLQDLLLHCKRLTGHPKTYLNMLLCCSVSWQLPCVIQIKYYLLLITQQQSKDLNSLNDKTDSVQR